MFKRSTIRSGKTLRSLLLKSILVVSTLLLYVGCADEVPFVQARTTQFFTQDYNPEMLDILWVLDTRSPMFPIQSHVVDEATNFFRRLDGAAHGYQMSFITVDMDTSHGGGKLQPEGNGIILNKGDGTLEQRAQNFRDVFSKDIINLQTGGLSKGFSAAEAAFNKSEFVSASNIPLVIIFISDSDEKSAESVEHYRDFFLGLKNNDADLVRVYSINFTNSGDRCTNNQFHADIDQTATFQDRYFELARLLNGDTADICESGFSDKIDIIGLKLNTPKIQYHLEKRPNPDTLDVVVTINGQIHTADLPWSYDPVANDIIFYVPPPEGATIQVTFVTN